MERAAALFSSTPLTDPLSLSAAVLIALLEPPSQRMRRAAPPATAEAPVTAALVRALMNFSLNYGFLS
jgi:hypothetical protein